MKKCQMHNKKRDKLSYTVMLHSSSVTGGFVCHFLVHLHDFRQWAVQWATHIFFATDVLVLAQVLMQFAPPPSTQRGRLGTQSSQQQVPVKQQHTACTGDTVPCMETQQGHPAFTGAGEAAVLPSTSMMVLDLPQLSRSSEHTLGRAQTCWLRVGCTGGTEHKIHPWYHHHWLQCSFGAEEPLTSLYNLFVPMAAFLVTTPVKCELLKGFKGLPNAKEAAIQEMVAPWNLPGYCNCYALSHRLAGT